MEPMKPPHPLNTDTEGTVTREAPAQPAWERHLKQILAVVVIGCGAALPMLSQTEDALAYKACAWVMAVGAGLGITSTGNAKK